MSQAIPINLKNSQSLWATIRSISLARFENSLAKPWANLGDLARLERAQTLLADHRLSIAEIAQMAGFTDQSHLNRLFRRCFNLTPQEVRRMQNS